MKFSAAQYKQLFVLINERRKYGRRGKKLHTNHPSFDLQVSWLNSAEESAAVLDAEDRGLYRDLIADRSRNV